MTTIAINQKYIILYQVINEGLKQKYWLAYAKIFEDKDKAIAVAKELFSHWQIVAAPFDAHAKALS
jgi:hypothetical protein